MRARLLCPNHVGTLSDHDALLEVAVKAIGDFGHAESLDDPETFAAQHFGKLVEIAWRVRYGTTPEPSKKRGAIGSKTSSLWFHRPGCRSPPEFRPLPSVLEPLQRLKDLGLPRLR